MVLSEPEPTLPSWHRWLRQIDWITILLVALLIAFGFIAIYSVSPKSGMEHLLHASLGLIATLILSWTPYSWLERIVLLAYAGGLFLLALVLLIGQAVHGSKSWFSIAGTTFQPVELAKLTTLLFLAHFLSSENRSLRQLRTVLVGGAIVLFPALLVLLQPDAGSAMVFGALLLTVFLWGGAHPLVVLMPVAVAAVALLSLMGTTALLLGILVAAVAIFLTRPRLLPALLCVAGIVAAGWGASSLYRFLKPHQQARIQSLLNPEQNPQSTGYHVIQSILAIGSGGLTGKGFQQGTQTQLRFVPQQINDFIFCVPAEEFGFVGATLLLAVLFGLLWHVFTLAHRLRDEPFWSLLISGIGGIWFFHAAINIGMALGIAPVIGLPLPFVSSGGSALTINMAMVGLLLNGYRQLYRTR